ncbi:MAG: TetR family transcriptional regulator [Planctomycetes bacterium]|nr:TetR family transcriptional regulator [Planctomycetota bacterium]
MAAADTRETLLDAAEELLAEQGYAATSLRQLTARAGANLAAVNYHFGSKEALAKAVLERRIAPINAERLRRLAAIPPRRRRVEAIVRAFVEPPLRGGAGTGERLCRVFGRMSVEQPPFLRVFLGQQFRGVARRFHAALRATLPGHGEAEVWWRLHFTVGAMAHALQNAHLFADFTHGLCRADDVDQLVDQLVAFAAGGLRAASTAAPARRRA